MKILNRLFSSEGGPSERQIKRAVKQVTQQHGDASVRVSAMERLSQWGTPEAAKALLRRFTIQVPQESMDLEEKQYTVRLLVSMGRAAVEPILQFIRTEPDVTWPARALREIVPPEEFKAALKSTLDHLCQAYTRWPEAKTVLVEHLPNDALPLVRSTLMHMLEDEDDDVCVAAADYLARNGDEEIRENLIQIYLNAESRPRVRARILDHFCEREWPVKGYRKKVEETLTDPYYLTSKGTVKRRPV